MQGSATCGSGAAGGSLDPLWLSVVAENDEEPTNSFECNMKTNTRHRNLASLEYV